MNRFWTLTALLLAVPLIDLAAWFVSGAWDCGSSCSGFQDMVRYGLWLLPVASVTFVIASISRMRHRR